MKKIFLGVFPLLFTTLSWSFAVQCPGNNTQFVYSGATIEEVIATCGKPNTIEQATPRAAVWTYVMVAFSLHRAGMQLYFQQNELQRITTSQSIEKQSMKCPNGVVNIGSSEQEVLNACGEPSSRRILSHDTTEHITLVYKTPNAYPNQTAFHFVNGKLH